MNKFETDDFYEQLSVNLERELNEELLIEGERLSLETIGLINDDENEVGKVHICLLIIAELDENANVSVKETDQLKGEWISIQNLPYADTYERLESWSKFVTDILVKDI
jgi:predicted NUDIX family phosphoesterase